MNSYLVAKSPLTDPRRHPCATSRAEEAARLAEPCLSRRASLMLALLLSLALWVAICATTITLASMVFH